MELAPVPMQVWAGVAPLVWQQIAAAPVPQQVSLVPQQDWLGVVPQLFPLGQQMAPVPVPIQVSAVEQQAAPQI